MGPLDGLRVIELGFMIAGPWATAMLADLGAEVIKVEGPAGDVGRHIVGPLEDNTSVLFENMNRGKKSVRLDLGQEEARRAMHKLVATADVFITNLRPSFLERVGLDPRGLEARFPELLIAIVSTYGYDDERSNVAGGDIIAQAESGLPHYTGDPAGSPLLALGAGADAVGAMHVVMSTLAALLGRAKHGGGKLIDVALIDCFMNTDPTVLPLVAASEGSYQPERMGPRHTEIVPHGVFRGADGYVALTGYGSGVNSHWPRLAEALERPELADAADFATDKLRLLRLPEIVDVIESWLASVGDDDRAVEILRSHGVVSARVKSPAEALFDERAVRRHVQSVVDTAVGPLRLMGGPFKFGHGWSPEGSAPRPAPALGQHTREVLVQVLGYPESQLDVLTGGWSSGHP